MSAFVRMLHDEAGSTLAEYALILGMIALISVAGLSAVVAGANGNLATLSGGLRGLADNPPS
jgi:Flp pilus assembly pilin Flp